MNWKWTWLCLALCVPAAGATSAQSGSSYNMAGLTCAKILAMKEEDWAEYFAKKTNDDSEAGYDEAYRTYAHCLRKRNDPALAKLPAATTKRIRQLRVLCADFRVECLSLAQAYSGGGTAFGHAMNRGAVDDERLTAALIQANRRSSAAAGRSGRVEAKSAHLQRALRAVNPALASNRKDLNEYDTVEQGNEAYKKIKQDAVNILALLSPARSEEKRLVVTFLDDNVGNLRGNGR